MFLNEKAKNGVLDQLIQTCIRILNLCRFVSTILHEHKMKEDRNFAKQQIYEQTILLVSLINDSIDSFICKFQSRSSNHNLKKFHLIRPNCEADESSSRDTADSEDITSTKIFSKESSAQELTNAIKENVKVVLKEVDYSSIMSDKTANGDKSEDQEITKPLSQSELIPNDDALNIKEEDYEIVDVKNFTESGVTRKIALMAVVEEYTVLIRQSMVQKGDQYYRENTMYAFTKGETLPMFSYIMPTELTPLSLDLVILESTTVTKGNPTKELQALLMVNDETQKKILLQYVLINHKRFKNIVYTSAILPGSPNFLRVRNLPRTKSFDVMMNTGQSKFMYFRYQNTVTTWYNSIRDDHIVFTPNASSQTMISECVDFQHEIYPVDENSSSMSFLIRTDKFYSIIFANVEFDQKTKQSKIYKTRSIDDISCMTTVYSSMIYNARQNVLILAGVGSVSYKNKNSFYFKYTPIAIDEELEKEDNRNNDSTIESSTLIEPKLKKLESKLDSLENAVKLNFYDELAQYRILTENPQDVQELIDRMKERLPIQAMSEAVEMEQGHDSKKIIGSNSLITLGFEDYLYRLTQQYDKYALHRLNVLKNYDSAGNEETNKDIETNSSFLNHIGLIESQKDKFEDKCFIVSFGPKSMTPLLSEKARSLTLSMSKGFIMQIKLKIMGPLEETRNGKKSLDSTFSSSTMI